MLHEIGKSKNVNFLGKKEVIYNHNAKRVYYYVRNNIYYSNKHKKYAKKNKIHAQLLKRIALILIFEEKKMLKIKSILKGIKDGNKMNKGGIIEND